ncbi:hypothetical protein BOW53_09375 [Solemya pervernicosa gill symbiont]|uniref:Virulence factor n=2 Tax=Gammaproteobacteria incertae sedis TaxID=118884 RepID=A0A1T2L4F1_9GAMM|nr:hypothetical protein [Candidatus Reidiella endopervernicosa]OOZ39977.1 hypothetical protein BOW53_09375 [Solemya pervernicosa gill symbiont]QKQ27777.1 hypothetical protein HUE57_16920 [Candidatus Reidiella endopervernicosa]
MHYAIVINLDYENYPYQQCSELWGEIKQRMMNVGFRNDGRLFKTTLGADQACEVAREVIESIEADYPIYQDSLLNDYIKEFYGYDHGSSTNLLLPPVAGIMINE